MLSVFKWSNPTGRRHLWRGERSNSYKGRDRQFDPHQQVFEEGICGARCLQDVPPNLRHILRVYEATYRGTEQCKRLQATAVPRVDFYRKAGSCNSDTNHRIELLDYVLFILWTVKNWRETLNRNVSSF